MLLLDMLEGVWLVLSSSDRVSVRDVHVRRPPGEVLVGARADLAVGAFTLPFVIAVAHVSFRVSQCVCGGGACVRARVCVCVYFPLRSLPLLFSRLFLEGGGGVGCLCL